MDVPESKGQTDPVEPSGHSARDIKRDYKSICRKLGLIMCLYFVCRIIGGSISSVIFGHADVIGHTAAHILGMTVVVIFVYIIPMLVTALMFGSMSYYNIRSVQFRKLYEKPERLARAIGTFPAMYGLGYGVALLTLLLSFLISRATGGQTFIEDILRPTTIETTTSLGSALVMVFVLVVIAPIFEEIWVRGIMYDALKPYGTGIAIIISSIIFGLMHGSLYMLFYTTALGFALGYVRYATNSLLIVTILHAMINAVAAGMLFMMTMTEITMEESVIVNTVQNVYILAVLALIIVGIIAFIVRIPTIRRYKLENSWNSVSGGRKTALFFFSIPAIIMLVLAFNELTNYWLISLIL